MEKITKFIVTPWGIIIVTVLVVAAIFRVPAIRKPVTGM